MLFLSKRLICEPWCCVVCVCVCVFPFFSFLLLFPSTIKRPSSFHCEKCFYFFFLIMFFFIFAGAVPWELHTIDYTSIYSRAGRAQHSAQTLHTEYRLPGSVKIMFMLFGVLCNVVVVIFFLFWCFRSGKLWKKKQDLRMYPLTRSWRLMARSLVLIALNVKRNTQRRLWKRQCFRMKYQNALQMTVAELSRFFILFYFFLNAHKLDHEKKRDKTTKEKYIKQTFSTHTAQHSIMVHRSTALIKIAFDLTKKMRERERERKKERPTHTPAFFFLVVFECLVVHTDFFFIFLF